MEKRANGDKRAKGFNSRAFVALMILLSVMGLPITGIANHLLGLSPMTEQRHAWMAAHNVLSVLFVIFSIWHIVLNRRLLWNHLRSAAPLAMVVGREALVAVVIVGASLLLFVGHALHVPS